MVRVVGTDTYLREVARWPQHDRVAAAKVPAQLAANPFLGAPLGYPFLREKRIRGRRIYYFVYEDLQLVLLVATSGKKDQQATIDHLKKQLPVFRVVAGKIARQGS